MPETIITAETPSTSSQFNPSSHVICLVCQKQFSLYTCPRCNSRYCSLQCYKSHSLRCTELFMRENVLGELQQMQAGDGTKQKMLEILKRFHSEEEIDISQEDGSALSEKTIQKIMSGTEISFDDLSAEERKCFRRAVASGELGKLIKPWDPWWLEHAARTISLGQDGSRLVQPIIKEETVSSSEDDMEIDQYDDIPPGPETPLPPVSKLTSNDPSPLLSVHLVDIVYSFCFTLRLYNGDWKSDAIGSTMVMLSVSSVLGQVRLPETVLEALSYCLEQTCSPAFKHIGGFQFGLGLMDDVVRLLSLGQAALICLLCDLHRLLQAAQRELKSEESQKSKAVKIRSKLKSAERKVYFMMCWVHEQPEGAWSSLEAIVEAEKSSAMEYEGNKGGTLRMQVKDETRSKPLIKEVE